MDNKKLDALRNNINALDDKILDLLRERADIVTEIGKEKKPTSSVVDYDREQKVLDRILQHTKAKYSKDSIVRIWREIFQASTKLQEIDRPIIDSKRSINLINIYTPINYRTLKLSQKQTFEPVFSNLKSEMILNTL